MVVQSTPDKKKSDAPKGNALYENHTKGCDETPKRQGLSARQPL